MGCPRFGLVQGDVRDPILDLELERLVVHDGYGTQAYDTSGTVFSCLENVVCTAIRACRHGALDGAGKTTDR
jgi:hypothetical protein